jgi:hypothetical protein
MCWAQSYGIIKSGVAFSFVEVTSFGKKRSLTFKTASDPINSDDREARQAKVYIRQLVY